jgi:ABC-type branched-subunit amino acid transport system ATPase component
MSGVAMEVVGLTAGYGEAMVLRDLSLRVEAGEVLAVVGKNGMGKSTLLKTVMGLLPAQGGRIRLLGEDVTGWPPHAHAARAVAYSPQDYAIFQDLTVEENLKLGVARGERFVPAMERVAALFPFLGQRRRQRAGTLSGGEQKMLIIARALIARPRLMLIDEITEGLQPSVILRLTDILRTQNRLEGSAILLIEQNVHFALSLADRYAVLTRGEIAAAGDARAPDVEAQIADMMTV